MSSIRVLALSSSRVRNSGYLENALSIIQDFLGNQPLKVAFIPFAAADKNYDEYVSRTRTALSTLPYTLEVVKPENAKEVVSNANVIMTGGGNTFKLLHDLYELRLTDLIGDKVRQGTPYVGWSAGANITGLTISTTNDMPIIEPQSFKALAFFPFQINPHYINVKPEGHNGETRDERLTEFLIVNPGIPVVGLPEGTALRLEGTDLKLIGETDAVLFKTKESKDIERSLIQNGTDLSYLLN